MTTPNKSNFLKALFTPKTRLVVNEEAHLNSLLNDALLNYEKVKNANYPMEFRVAKFLEARKQILEVLEHER